MKHLLTAIACFLALSMSAQTPYNPDFDNDSLITFIGSMLSYSLCLLHMATEAIVATCSQGDLLIAAITLIIVISNAPTLTHLLGATWVCMWRGVPDKNETRRKQHLTRRFDAIHQTLIRQIVRQYCPGYCARVPIWKQLRTGHIV